MDKEKNQALDGFFERKIKDLDLKVDSAHFEEAMSLLDSSKATPAKSKKFGYWASGILALMVIGSILIWHFSTQEKEQLAVNSTNKNINIAVKEENTNSYSSMTDIESDPKSSTVESKAIDNEGISKKIQTQTVFNSTEENTIKTDIKNTQPSSNVLKNLSNSSSVNTNRLNTSKANQNVIEQKHKDNNGLGQQQLSQTSTASLSNQLSTQSDIPTTTSTKSSPENTIVSNQVSNESEPKQSSISDLGANLVSDVPNLKQTAVSDLESNAESLSRFLNLEQLLEQRNITPLFTQLNLDVSASPIQLPATKGKFYQKKSGLFWGINAGIAMNIAELRNSNSDAANLLARRKTEESNDWAPSFELNIGYQKNRWVFTSGLGYSEFSRRGNHSNGIFKDTFSVAMVLDTQPRFVLNRLNPTIILDTFYVQVMVPDTTRFQVPATADASLLKNRLGMRFLEIPLKVGYAFGNGRWGVVPSAGLGIGMKIEEFGYALKTDMTGFSAPSIKNSFLLNLIGDLRLQYHINRRWQVGIGLFGRYNLTPITHNESFDWRFLSYGLDVGVRQMIY